MRPVTTDQLFERLRTHRGALGALGVDALYLYGSQARGDATADSDVDLFFDSTRPRLNLFDVMAIRDEIEAVLGRPADVATRQSLHAYLRPRIEQSAIRIF
jgi:predicted nucleotidyltransferase